MHQSIPDGLVEVGVTRAVAVGLEAGFAVGIGFCAELTDLTLALAVAPVSACAAELAVALGVNDELAPGLATSGSTEIVDLSLGDRPGGSPVFAGLSTLVASVGC